MKKPPASSIISSYINPRVISSTEVDTANIRVENQLDFGRPWLALQLIHKLKFDELLETVIPQGREEIPWSKMALVLAICRLCNPSSELYIAEHYYKSTAMPELLGVPSEKVYDERLYRALDKLLPHKKVLGKHLKARLSSLFGLKYDLLLYDVTSTYFSSQVPECHKCHIAFRKIAEKPMR